MSDTVLRHWMMLRHLPRYPRKIDAAGLADVLADAGYEVSRRSIERDLHKLSAVFPIVCDDQHKPYGWSWLATAAAFDLPAMDVHAALAFRMAAEHLRGLLPEVTRGYLEPHFLRAQAVLDSQDDNALSRWPDKVRVVPPGQPLLPPAIGREVLENVQAGLLAERQLSVVYRKRGETEPRTYIAHPQALVWRDAVGYLLVTLWDYGDLKQLVLHRMESVAILDAPRRALPDFAVDEEIASGSVDFLLTGGLVLVEALFDPLVAVRVRETPVAANQQLEDQPDGRVLLRATLLDTVQLRAWLRSYGEFVEVLAPPDLRASLADSARAMVARYVIQSPSS